MQQYCVGRVILFTSIRRWLMQISILKHDKPGNETLQSHSCPRPQPGRRRVTLRCIV